MATCVESLSTTSSAVGSFPLEQQWVRRGPPSSAEWQRQKKRQKKTKGKSSAWPQQLPKLSVCMCAKQEKRRRRRRNGRRLKRAGNVWLSRAWALSGVWAPKEGRVKVGGWAAPPLFVLLDRESEIRIPESSRNLSRRDAQQLTASPTVSSTLLTPHPSSKAAAQDKSPLCSSFI